MWRLDWRWEEINTALRQAVRQRAALTRTVLVHNLVRLAPLLPLSSNVRSLAHQPGQSRRDITSALVSAVVAQTRLRRLQILRRSPNMINAKPMV